MVTDLTNLNKQKDIDLNNQTAQNIQNSMNQIDFTNQANIAFGKKAEEMSLKTPDYLKQRNDYITNTMSKNYKTFEEANQGLSKFITDYSIKNPDISQQDVTNTYNSLSGLLKQKYPTTVTQSNQLGNTNNITANLTQGLQDEQKKLKEEQTKAVSDAFKGYNLSKAEYETNKGYYTNFDEKNNKFNNVLNSLQTIQTQYPDKPLSDEQLQQIASQYGVTLDEVKNPLKIFEGLQLTEEGKNKVGVTGYEQGIKDMETDFERKKADLSTNLTNIETNINNQIDDVALKLQRNLDWMTAQGAWMGANASSAYLQGIKNTKEEGVRTINKLKEQLNQIKTASAEDVARLTQDYNTNLERAKQDFDSQYKDLTHNMGLQINGLTEKYGLGNKTLSTALDNIMKEFGTKSADLVTKYADAFKAINENTNTGMDLIKQATDLQDQVENKRYNEYISNDGILLQNTSLKNLQQEVTNGTISTQKYNDLKTIMATSIQGTLSKLSPLTQVDLNTIENLLNQGKTPAEIVAKFQTDERFKPKVEIDKTIDLGDRTRIYYKDGTYEDIDKESSTKPITVGKDSYIYDPVSKTFKSPKGGEISGDKSSLLSNLQAIPEGTEGGECVAFVNDQLEAAGLGSFSHDKDQSLSNKISKKNSDTPTIGSVLIRTSPTEPKYGDVVIVTGIDGDTISYKGSNKAGEGEVYTGTIDINDPSIKGYYDPTLNKKQGQKSEIGYNPDKMSQYIAYVEKDGKLPSGMSEGTEEADKFIEEAVKGYIAGKENEVKQNGFTISNPDAYITNGIKRKDEISTAITNVKPFLQSMNKVIELVDKYGAELPTTEAGRQMNQEIKNAQLLAKEIYNLGVLNGPDLSLMEAILTNPTSVYANTLGRVQDLKGVLEKGKQAILDNMKAKAESIGLKYSLDDTGKSGQKTLDDIWNE